MGAAPADMLIPVDWYLYLSAALFIVGAATGPDPPRVLPPGRGESAEDKDAVRTGAISPSSDRRGRP